MQVDQYTIFSKPSSSIDELISSIVSSTHKIGIYVNLDCAAGMEFFVKASEKNLLRNKYSWLLLGDITQSVKSKLEKCKNLNLMSDVMFAIRNETAFDLFYVYKMSNGSSLAIKKAGFWERNSGIRFATNGSLIHQRRNWEGVLVEGITVLSDFKLNNTEDGLRELADPNFKYHQDIMSRFCYVLFKNFEKLYNMTSIFTFRAPNYMGSPDSLLLHSQQASGYQS
ncbi:uncharacterized protein LOC111055863 [Nilaparvata lugens]|uniref:uncharacterized protein LOC111055863 n=1 Tax=Nilaparvata lugens TaxID=108931 RepID=UPI00193DECEA|nr:uncharacterized protein LOC111055863 [Nilaparvata lugens]